VRDRLLGDTPKRAVGELERDAFEREEALILLEGRVVGPSEDMEEFVLRKPLTCTRVTQ